MDSKSSNTNGMSLHDVSSEEWREYVYADGAIFRVDCPRSLYLKQDERGDSHRVVDKQGVTHYPRRGWIGLRWKSSPEVEF